MKRLATEHPLRFVLVVLLGWIITGLLFALVAAGLLRTELASDLAQSVGTLVATGLLLVLAWRLDWLRRAGITRLGGRQVWLLTAAAVLYFYVGYRYAFFGGQPPEPGLLFRLPAARAVFVRQVVVGFVEETLFRGVMLYALVRAWGTTRRGLTAAIVTAALLFGSLHIVQLASGNALAATLLTMALSVLSGIWLGALVLRWGSIWPGVAIHAASNMVVNIGALAVPDFVPATSAFVVALLMEVPLLLWALWMLWHGPLITEPDAVEARTSQLSKGVAAP
jgi:membrane protease YdiL (CAAX protease family)